MFVDMTIFCSYFDKSKKDNRYIRKIINGVFWADTKVVNTNTTGMTDVNTLNVFIPKENVSNYISPKKYASLENPDNHITFKEGDKIVKGIIEKDYTSMVELDKEQDNVFTITGADYKDYGTRPHFALSGK